MAKIVLTWQTREQYRVTFDTEEQWVKFVRSVNDALDPTDLDAVYDYLNTGQGLSEEYITEMQSPHTWFNQIEFEVDDIQRVPEVRPDEMRSDT